jgi:hypothetical protein
LRCPRCQFENLPGQAACFRCGSLLEAKAGSIEVHPPRAPAWRKPFRRALRRMRHFGAARQAEKLAHRAAERSATAAFRVTGLPRRSSSEGELKWGELWLALRDAAIALALSIVPGLAHAVRHQFGAIYLYVISWLVSLVMGILFFGKSLGSASMASAFVLHAWIAMDAVVGTKRFKEEMTAAARMGWRLFGIGAGVLLLYVVYVQVQSAIGFTVGLSGVTVPAHNVARGDSILCRFLPANREPALKRGDLVLVRVSEVINGEGARGTRGEYVGELVGQLIGLPGDDLRLTPGGFVVNGRAYDPLKFLPQSSLRGQTASRRLGKDEYFVTMVWIATRRGVPAGAGDAGAPVDPRNCVYNRRDVLARGVMRWWPLRKRGFLEEFE